LEANETEESQLVDLKHMCRNRIRPRGAITSNQLLGEPRMSEKLEMGPARKTRAAASSNRDTSPWKSVVISEWETEEWIKSNDRKPNVKD
jgi:hypothetical protein